MLHKLDDLVVDCVVSGLGVSLKQFDNKILDTL